MRVTLSDCVRNAHLFVNMGSLAFDAASMLSADALQSDECTPMIRHPLGSSDAANDGSIQGPSQAHDVAHETAESTPQVPHKPSTSSPQVTGQADTKSALSRHQVEMLRKCIKDSSLVDLMAITERSDRTKFRHQVLNPLIAAGWIEMTVPDKPRSSKQRYRTTAAGRTVLAHAAKETPA